jgi:hypothetical protein
MTSQNSRAMNWFELIWYSRSDNIKYHQWICDDDERLSWKTNQESRKDWSLFKFNDFFTSIYHRIIVVDSQSIWSNIETNRIHHFNKES